MVPFDEDIRRWIGDRALDPTAADTSPAGARIHSRATNERARALLPDPARPASESALDLAGIPARLYRPGADGPRPLIVYMHGGGWTAGGTDTHAAHARRLCVEASAVVLAVDYRLAPEHRFPAAFDDCLAATRWAVSQDSAGVVVAGDSAGGQLAASVAIAGRDEGLPLAGQLLIVPATDLLGGYADAAVNALYPSRAENATGYGLMTAAMARYMDWYGVDTATPDWRTSPLRAPDLTGVAPAVVHTAGYDPLRDEGLAYARRLRESGVTVVERTWPALNHSYFALGGVSAAAEQAARAAAVDLSTILR